MQIKDHRDINYNKTSEITDAKHDQLEDELRQLDPENPLFFKIGAEYSKLFAKREHIMPMMSQDKARTPEEFKKWVKKRSYNECTLHFTLPFRIIAPLFLIILIYSENKNVTNIKKREFYHYKFINYK
ncbi:MAG: hypothetical protein BAJALOKI2v1_1110011 [Promethearchaeota archaeon]|nr:MAG: hypothetical protein BAJALOKI2v1_1110011 [Candidatus Lokiarchaeota archaeon]